MNKLSIFKKLTKEETREFKKQIMKDKSLLEETNLSGASLLQIAVAQGNLDLVIFLIENDVDVNHQDKKGNTALHYCPEYYQFEIAEYILEHNGKLNISDKFGNEPLWTAAVNVNKDLKGLDVVELFLKNGADPNHKNKRNMTPWDVANDPFFEPLVESMKKYL